MTLTTGGRAQRNRQADGRMRVGLYMGAPLANLIALALRHVDVDVEPITAVTRTTSPADVALIDLDLRPDTHRQRPAAQVVGLTRRWRPAARIAAMNDGVDDLVEIPFTPDEVVLRTIGALRRVRPSTIAIEQSVTVGSFALDVVTGDVSVEGRALPRLTPTETSLLYLFLANPGVLLSREAILTEIWGSEDVVSSNVIDRHIRDLRVKLQDRWQAPRFIETVAGQGYRSLVAPTRDQRQDLP